MAHQTIDVTILGAGGHGRDIMSIIKDIEQFNFIGFYDDIKTGPDVIGNIDSFCSTSNIQYIIGVNDSATRFDIDQKVKTYNKLAATVIHPRSYIGYNSTVSEGCVLSPYSVLTTDVTLDIHTHINTGATVSQNSKIGSYVTISPGAHICGDCNIGDITMIGAGSTVKNLINIGSKCIIGSGSNVIRNVDSNLTVVGNPARSI